MTSPAEQTIWLRGENGIVWEQRLPLPEGMADRLLKGYLTRVADADGNPYSEPRHAPAPAVVARTADTAPAAPTADPAAGAAPEGTAPPATPDPELPEPPADKDLKAVWVGYAVRNLGMSPDDAEAATKHDLIDRYRAEKNRRDGLAAQAEGSTDG